MEDSSCFHGGIYDICFDHGLEILDLLKIIQITCLLLFLMGCGDMFSVIQTINASIEKSITSFDRCKKFERSVIRETHYAIGFVSCFDDVQMEVCIINQIQTESACKEWVTALDGGMGLGQFMPVIAEWIQEREVALQELGYNPYNPEWSIRAITLYDDYLYDRTSCEGWYFAFRAYNGGLGLINGEIRRANSCIEPHVENQCKRRKNFCEINISYPKKIMVDNR